MSCSVRVSWARCAGRNSIVVRKLSQVRQAFGCGQVCCSGRPQEPLGSVCLARARFSMAHAASESGPLGVERDDLAADVDALLEALPLAAQRRVLDLRVAGG